MGIHILVYIRGGGGEERGERLKNVVKSECGIRRPSCRATAMARMDTKTDRLWRGARGSGWWAGRSYSSVVSK